MLGLFYFFLQVHRTGMYTVVSGKNPLGLVLKEAFLHGLA